MKHLFLAPKSSINMIETVSEISRLHNEICSPLPDSILNIVGTILCECLFGLCLAMGEFSLHSWMSIKYHFKVCNMHYDDVIMTMLASQITSLTVVYSIVYSGVNQGKYQSSASLAFVREIDRGPVNFPHKWPVTRKMFPFDDVIMGCRLRLNQNHWPSVTYFTQEVNSSWAKPALNFDGGLAIFKLTSFVKWATIMKSCVLGNCQNLLWR